MVDPVCPSYPVAPSNASTQSEPVVDDNRERDWINTSVYMDGRPARNQSRLHKLPPDDLNNEWMKSAERIGAPQKRKNLASVALSRAAFAVTSKLSQLLGFLVVRKMNEPAPVKPHHQEDQPLLPAKDVDDKLGFKHVEFSKTIARDEVCGTEKAVFALNRAIAKVTAVEAQNIPQMSDNLDDNMRRAMAKCLFSNIEGIVYPQTPDAIEKMRDDVVSAVALAGPFAGYIERCEGANAYRIDLSKMCAYPVRDGYAPLGFIAELHYDECSEEMVVDWIDLPAENTRVVAADVYSDDPAVRARAAKAWQRAQRIAMASMATHMTAVRHLLGCHLKVGEVFSALNNTYLSEKNPVAHVMQRFLYRVQATNHYRIPSLVSDESSALPAIFSYNRQNVRKLIDDAALEFDLSRMDPREDAKQRNMADAPIKYPHLENVGEIWDILESHAQAYVKAFYEDDFAVQNDAEVRRWFDAVGEHVRGAHDYVGPLGIGALAKLITVVMYSEAIEHEHVGAGMVGDYVLLPEIPSNVRLNGDLPSQSEFQTLVILLLLTSLPAASGKPFDPNSPQRVKPFYELLSDDYPGMAPKGVDIMRNMRDKLAELDNRLRAAQEKVASHVVLPSKCEASAAA